MTGESAEEDPFFENFFGHLDDESKQAMRRVIDHLRAARDDEIPTILVEGDDDSRQLSDIERQHLLLFFKYFEIWDERQQ